MNKSKFFSFLTAIAVVVSFISCEKEGPVGPIGPQGPAGSSITLQTDSFYVASTSWNVVATNYYTVSIPNSHITADVVNKGVINAYLYSYSDSQWYSLDDVVAGGSGYRFAFKVGTLTLFADNVTGVPISRPFKIVLIKNN